MATVASLQVLRCVLSVSFTYFAPDGPVAVETPRSWDRSRDSTVLEDTLLWSYHRAQKWTLLVLGYAPDLNQMYPTHIEPTSVVVLLDGQPDWQMGFAMKRLRRNAWNPQARLVIAVAIPLSRKSKRELLAKRFLFNARLQLGAQHAVVLVARRDGVIEAFVWRPLRPSEHCEKQLSSVTALDFWLPDAGRFALGIDLFPFKVLTDLGGCTIVAALNPWTPVVMPSVVTNKDVVRYEEGLEVRVIEAVARATNFKVSYVTLGNYKNIKMLVNWSAHIAGPYWLLETDIKCFSGTRVHFSDSMVWAVPRPGLVPLWLGIIRSFSLDVWLLVFLALAAGAAVLWGLEGRAALFEVLLMNLGGSPTWTPGRPAASAFLALWLFYSLLIATAYQCCLIGLLTSPAVLPPLRDLDEVRAAGIQLASSFYFDEDDMHAPVPKTICDTDNLTDCLDRVAHARDLALLGPELHLDFVAHSIYLHEGKPLFTTLPQRADRGYLVLLLTRGSFLLPRVDAIFSRLTSAGIVLKWERDIQACYFGHFRPHHFEEPATVLTLSHLQGAFYLLMIGLLVATATFVVEWIRHLIQHRRLSVA